MSPLCFDLVFRLCILSLVVGIRDYVYNYWLTTLSLTKKYCGDLINSPLPQYLLYYSDVTRVQFSSVSEIFLPSVHL